MMPLDLEATGSFVTPSAKKRKARGQSHVTLRESTDSNEDEDDNYTYIRRRKKSKSKTYYEPVVTQQVNDDAIVVMHETCNDQHV
jgi:DNA polymerase II large subunit